MGETPQDPTVKHPQPEFAQQDQEPPGWTGPMDPRPDTARTPTGGAGCCRTAQR